MDPDTPPWDSPKFREKKDTAWVAGCRWLQSWWRDQHGYAPGELSQSNERVVCSMLAGDTGAEANFYGPNVVGAVDEFILHGEDTPLPALDQLFRNLLSARAACFNLLGEFKATPADALAWVRTIDHGATDVVELRLPWTPDTKLHFSATTTFDALVDYRAGTARRFLAVHCVYGQDLATDTTKLRQGHVDFTSAHPHWRDGAARRLDRAQLRALWLDALVAQSLTDKGGYDAGRAVVVACAADEATLGATSLVRAELVDPDTSLVWSPLEAVVDALRPIGPDWATWFSRRYLDFTPVLQLLDADDARRGGARPASDVGGLEDLAAIGAHVFGESRALAALLTQVGDGRVAARRVSALNDRARELAVDLTAFRDALRDVGA